MPDWLFRAQGDIDLAGANPQKDATFPISPIRENMITTFFRVAVVSGGGYASYDVEVHDSGVGAAMVASTERIKRLGVAPQADGLIIAENPDNISYADLNPSPNTNSIYVRIRATGGGPAAKVKVMLEGIRPRSMH